ncbi:MAG TPA: GFA family protein [Myxococcaceae bacterium]
MEAKREEQKHTGGCHCGAIRFEVALEPGQPASRCNCSVCTKVSPTGRIVKPGAFKLLQGEQSCSVYEWGFKVSKRFFCKHCGVHCYGQGHLEELGGDYVSVNVNTLDDIDPAQLQVIYFDGRHNNWEGGPRSTPWPVHPVAAAS